MKSNFKKLSTVIIVLIFLICCATKSVASSATVPISINVSGKAIITQPELERNGSAHLNATIKLSPNEGKYTDHISSRVRTNLSQWRLFATRRDYDSVFRKIDPNMVKVKLDLTGGEKGNLRSAQIARNFNGAAKLTDISDSSETLILTGISKTSLETDAGNYQNWLQLTLNCSYYPDEFTVHGSQLYTEISYTLVGI